MKCPVDRTALVQAGHTWKCPQCDGAWVDEATLVAMLEASSSTFIELPWQPRPADQVRPCADCDAPMETVALGAVALDRCPAHGVWCDAKELVTLLAHSKEFRAKPHHDDGDHPHHSLLYRLAHLLDHRE